MEEELKPLTESSANTQVETTVETTTETRLENLPRVEDLIKSEQEVKTQQKIEGLTESVVHAEERQFARKKDQKKAFMKQRLKVVTGVYIAVVSLLLAFVGVNVATLAILNNEINSNTNTIQMENYLISNEAPIEEVQTPSQAPLEITLNEPRDYSDDKKELTFLDKLTILFRNLFS